MRAIEPQESISQAHQEQAKWCDTHRGPHLARGAVVAVLAAIVLVVQTGGAQVAHGGAGRALVAARRALDAAGYESTRGKDGSRGPRRRKAATPRKHWTAAQHARGGGGSFATPPVVDSPDEQARAVGVLAGGARQARVRSVHIGHLARVAQLRNTTSAITEVRLMISNQGDLARSKHTAKQTTRAQINDSTER